MTNLFKINKILSITIFFLSLIFLSLFYLKINLIITTPVCFFLIATIGISHGSLDHLKGYKILKFYKIKHKFLFYLIYVFVSLTVIFFWITLPLITLCLFLIIASFHFGKEDSSFDKIKNRNFINFYFFLKGSIIILAPLWTNPEETIKIFEILNSQFIDFKKNIIFLLIGISLLSNFLISKNIVIGLMDSLTVIILNLIFSPLVAFTLYFCFLHSIRHTLSLIVEINSKNFKKGFLVFIKKALPLILVTAFMFIVTIYFLRNYYVLDDAILKVIFIGLASLTFPHILLEYLLEKNEK